MTFRNAFTTFTLVVAVFCPAMRAQEQEKVEPPIVRRPSLGVRFVYIGSPGFETFGAQQSTTKPIADYTYSASTSKGRLRVSPNLEYRLTPRISLGLEFLFEHAEYKQTTQIRSGTKDPNASTDTRPVTTTTETTRSSYWELPFMARYYRLRRSGILSKAYIAGGAAYRHIGNVRSGTEYQNADGTTDYNEIAATRASTNQVGFGGGIGIRFVDDFRIKITPELRIIRWLGHSFEGPSYRSAPYQYAATLGFSF